MTNKFAQTPFRLAMNDGDPELKVRGGEKSVASPYSGKVSQKIYDSSDYIRFKKLQAINKNYNDYSFGGAENSQSHHAIRNVRK